MRRLVVVLWIGILIAGVAAAPSGASASQPGAQGTVGSAWLAAQRLAIAGAKPADETGMHASPFGQLVQAGDLNDDGRADVLDTRSVDVGARSQEYGVTARDGRTGKALWARSYPDPTGQDDFAQDARFGQKGTPGVLVTTTSVTSSGGTDKYDLELIALSGPTGKVFWQHRFSGTSTATTRVDVPYFIGAVDDRKGKATDYLLSVQNHAADNSDVTRPFVVSGVDGKTRSAGSGFSAADDVGYPDVVVSPDLDGDGFADMVGLIIGTPGAIVAERIKSGHELWTNATYNVDHQTSIDPIGPFLRTSIGSLILSSESALGDGRRPLHLIDGLDGTSKWTRMASSDYVLGTAGNKRTPAVGFVTFRQASSATHETNSAKFRAVTATDHVIYAGHAVVSVPKVAGATGTGDITGFDVLGDVQPDGSADARPYLSISSSNDTTSHDDTLTGVVDGRTGSFRAVRFETSASGSLQNGLGTDLLDPKVKNGKASYIALNGETGKKFYHRSIAGQNQIDGEELIGLRATGNDCSDIGFSTISTDDTHGTTGMLSARGALLWTVYYSDAQPTGGRVKHFEQPSQYCI